MFEEVIMNKTTHLNHLDVKLLYHEMTDFLEGELL